MEKNNHIIISVYCFYECVLRYTIMETIYEYNYMIILFHLAKNDVFTIINMC